jgi:hypothetical protein
VRETPIEPAGVAVANPLERMVSAPSLRRKPKTQRTGMTISVSPSDPTNARTVVSAIGRNSFAD